MGSIDDVSLFRGNGSITCTVGWGGWLRGALDGATLWMDADADGTGVGQDRRRGEEMRT